jgi:DNA-binding transcriptional LysR family regulator
MKALDRGLVYVAAPQLLACTLLPKVLGAFAQAYPQIEVVLRDVASDSVLPRLRGGDVDIALGGERAGLQDIESELLFELPLHAVTQP